MEYYTSPRNLNRRRFIQSSVALGATALIAAPTNLQASRLDLGSFQIDTVSDGHLTLPGAMSAPGVPQEEIFAILDAYDLPHDIRTPDCNVTLLRDGERVILIDVGSGSEFMDSAGVLLESLELLDLTPEDVTDVIFTHAHPDHLWGVLDDFDDPMFPEARFQIGRKEWDYWMDPETVNTIDSGRTVFAVGAKRRLEAIEDRIEFFDDGDEILSGIAARASYGHTPGHMSFEVRSGNQSAMIIGDAIVNHHIAFERPDWSNGSDQDVETAIRTRIGLLDQVTSEQMPIVGFHFNNGGLGHAERKDGSYQFIAEV
ncbi:MAG: MBL fold metallo-hydrolase [Paracoccaceae bacterium]